MMHPLRRVFILVLGFALVAAACGNGEADDAPDATVATTAASSEPFAPESPECVAPSDPGGGWDFTCRTIGLLMEQLAGTGNVITTNQPGGGGAVAFADIAANRSDDNDLVIAASPATAIRFAQNPYTGLEADQVGVGCQVPGLRARVVDLTHNAATIVLAGANPHSQNASIIEHDYGMV